MFKDPSTSLAEFNEEPEMHSGGKAPWWGETCSEKPLDIFIFISLGVMWRSGTLPVE